MHTHSVPSRAFRIRYSFSTVAVSGVTHASDFRFCTVRFRVRRVATHAEFVRRSQVQIYGFFRVDIALPLLVF